MDEQQAVDVSPEPGADDGAQPAASEDREPDDLAVLRQRLRELEERAEKEAAQATDYMHRWQRVAADFSNFKRRTEQERDDLVKFSNQMLIGQILAVVDNFERAFTSIPRELRSLSWISGVDLIYQQLYGVLMQQGLEAVAPAQNERYDPQVHEAISYEPADGKEDGVIVRVYQTGYRLHGRLIRPALVTVAQGAPAAQPAEPPAATQTPADGEGQTSDASTADESPS